MAFASLVPDVYFWGDSRSDLMVGEVHFRPERHSHPGKTRFQNYARAVSVRSGRLDDSAVDLVGVDLFVDRLFDGLVEPIE